MHMSSTSDDNSQGADSIRSNPSIWSVDIQRLLLACAILFAILTLVTTAWACSLRRRLKQLHVGIVPNKLLLSTRSSGGGVIGAKSPHSTLIATTRSPRPTPIDRTPPPPPTNRTIVPPHTADDASIAPTTSGTSAIASSSSMITSSGIPHTQPGNGNDSGTSSSRSNEGKWDATLAPTPMMTTTSVMHTPPSPYRRPLFTNTLSSPDIMSSSVITPNMTDDSKNVVNHLPSNAINGSCARTPPAPRAAVARAHQLDITHIKNSTPSSP
jgi:hypothetical protein